MTVTFSYGNAAGFTDDCNNADAAVWVKEGGTPSLTATLAVDNGDYFKIVATAGSGSVYWEKNPANVTVGPSATQTYKKWRIRYKTSSESIQARVDVSYTSGSATLLSASSSLTWKVVEGTFSQDKTLDKIQIYAFSATGTVWYDFIQIFEGTFTFPNANVDPYFPEPRIPYIDIPCRDGEVLQNLGSKYVRVHIEADLDQGEWGTPSGRYLWKLFHEHSTDLWFWFTDSEHDVKFKACLEPCHMPFTDGALSLDLWLKEYKLGDAVENESFVERYGFTA